MNEPDVTPGRLDSFSDGVIAIVITVMVLELRPPEIGDWKGLVTVWPDFLSYFISFGFVAIFWVNHRHILKHIHTLTEPILWANIALLFLLSLIPFSTAYMGRTHLSAFPMAIYSGVLLACGATFGILRTLIAAGIADAHKRRQFNGPKVVSVGVGTVVLLLLSMLLSFVNPVAALGVIVLSSVLHLAPFTRS